MRKKEKGIYLYFLRREREILEALEKLYKEALEEIEEEIYYAQGDALIQNTVYRKEYQRTLAGQMQAILEKLHTNEYKTISDYLKDCYTDGASAVAYSMHQQGVPLILPIDQAQVVAALMTHSAISEGLYKSLGTDTSELRKVIAAEISRGLATNRQYGEIARNISTRMKIPLNRARTIVITEAHRIREEASQNTRVAAKEQGCNIVKQWDATMDNRTRPTHRRLDGQIREVDEPFEIDGKKAMYPGGFGRPEEDCNCRCVALTRAKWALDDDELERLKKRAEQFGLDKSKDFEDFKRKYLDAMKD